MRTSLGPAALNLGREGLFKFYKDAVNNTIDDFYLGEVSCPERGVKSKELLLEIARTIKKSGKKLYISTYALVTKMSQIDDIVDLLQFADGLEINDLAFLELDFDKTLIAGPFLNIYNSQSASYLARLGFKRVVLPSELSLESVIDITRNCELEIEVMFQGRRTLGISRRCYSLRALDLPDHACSVDCLKHPDGLSLDTCFRINGKEILGEEIHCLSEELPLLENSGVAVLRIKDPEFLRSFYS